MSDKDIATACLVIDASIARAAGAIDTVHPVGRLCRDFLMRVRGICHRMAWGPRMQAEWDRHRSTFAAGWLVTMNNLRKLRVLDDAPDEELIEAIEQSSQDDGVVAIMRKDAHLLVAALGTDARITSLDDVDRGHFARCLKGNPRIAAIVWVNPCAVEEKVVDWLRSGASMEAARQLGHTG